MFGKLRSKDSDCVARTGLRQTDKDEESAVECIWILNRTVELEKESEEARTTETL